MYSIHIAEHVNSLQALIDMLRNISDQIEQGNTSGYEPTWHLEETID